MPKQPFPYYIESYPAYPTYLFHGLGVYRIEKYLIDPMGKSPKMVVLQSFSGVNRIEELVDDPILFTANKALDTIDHYELCEVIASINYGEGELESLLGDLIGWRITTVRNGFSDSHETIDIESFCQRVYDYCQTEEELDIWWNYKDEVLAQFFAKNDSTENCATEKDSSEAPISAQETFEKLGFPTSGFNDIPSDLQPQLVDALYSQLSAYITTSIEEFNYLLLPTYKKEFANQPKIRWHTSSQQFMRAVFSRLFPKDVVKSEEKTCCYCFIKKKGDNPKPIKLNNNLEKITDSDKNKVVEIIRNCYSTIGIERKSIKLSCE